jgi:hypothetical protein
MAQFAGILLKLLHLSMDVSVDKALSRRTFRRKIGLEFLDVCLRLRKR